MSKSCVFIPKGENGEEYSKLFLDIHEYTKDRETTNALWALSKDSALMHELGIKDLKNLTAIELISKLDDIKSVLSTDGYIKYINNIEDIDEEFDTYSEAYNKSMEIVSKYEGVVPIITHEDGGYIIDIKESSEENEFKFIKQKQLSELNDSLIRYINKLGFDVEETEDLEYNGMFSPLSAETNAKGLKTAIKIAKGKQGQEALPEEVAHLLIEGAKNNPIIQRLLSSLSNRDILKAVLGDLYDTYVYKYGNNTDLLAKEAAGRLLAQHLADRSGLSSTVSYISNRAFDAINKLLEKGEETDVDKMLQRLYDEVGDISNKIIKDEVLEYFDSQLVDNSHTLYNTTEKVSKLHTLTRETYELMAKRIKLISLRSKDGKINTSDKLQYEALKQNLEKEKYAAGCLGFLNFVLNDISKVHGNLKDLKVNAVTKLSTPSLKRLFAQLKDVDTIKKAYTETVGRLAAISSDPDIIDELPESKIAQIEELAQEVSEALNKLDFTHRIMRQKAIYQFYSMYWDNNIEATVSGKKKTITLNDVLESNPFGDMSGISRLVNSLADASDPLLQLVYKVTKDAFNDRDSQIDLLQQKVAEIQARYTEKTGSKDVSFMFVKDSLGKPTGMLLSDIDYKAFYKAKSEELNRLKEKGLSNEKISTRLNAWYNRNTELVDIKLKGSNAVIRRERMPKASLYSLSSLSTLNEAQREYYDAIIEVKKQLDALIPTKNARLYRAPMIAMDTKEALLTGKSKIKDTLKAYGRSFVRKVDDTDYGETVYENGVYKVLDFNGEEVKKTPVYYTTFLDNMSTLNLNLSETIISYGAMAYNYAATNSIADVLEVTKSFYADRPVIKTSGLKQMYERFKVNGDAITNPYTIKGEHTTGYKRLDSFVDSMIYGKLRNDSSVKVGDVEISIDKIGDKIIHLNALNSMGLNLFSATSNLTMGLTQMLIEAGGGQYFGYKSIGKALKQYFSMAPSNIVSTYKDHKKDKLSLLLKKFDALESYYSDVKKSDMNSGLGKKILNRVNPLIGNIMGEHAVHSLGMLAILNEEKVLYEGKEISLIEALEVKETIEEGKTVYKIELKNGITSKEGKELNDDYLFSIKQKIQYCNSRLQGAYSTIDKGDLHKAIIGRLAGQFRQWMPALVMNRFSSKKSNIITGKEEEGYYVTLLSFLAGTISDLKNRKFNILTRFSELNEYEKSNIRKANIELGVLAVLAIILNSGFGNPDDEDPWAVNLLKYNMYRLRMEIAALSPTPAFVDNVTTLIKQPIPSINILESAIDVIDIFNSDIIENGRYKGWRTNVKALYQLTPTVKNVDRLLHFIEGEMDIFKPYTN